MAARLRIAAASLVTAIIVVRFLLVPRWPVTDVTARLLPQRAGTTLQEDANATDLDVTIFDAVLEEDVPQAEIPPTWATGDFHPTKGHLGCMTSHRRIWQQ